MTWADIAAGDVGRAAWVDTVEKLCRPVAGGNI
jgi:hypothetical protein